MDSKICVVWNTEKSFDKFQNKYTDCKQCKIQRSMKGYYENKDKFSDQRKIYYEKNRDMQSLKQINKIENFINNK